MFRSTRASAALIRSLLLGLAVPVALGATATSLVGCADESQPDYWVEKLEDPKWRPRAIKRMQEFFEYATTQDKENSSSQQVKTLLDKVVDPLTKTYVEGFDDLDTKSRVMLIKLLADFRDPRAEPALKKAFEEFAKRPREAEDDADIKWAIRAQTDLKLKGLAGPVLEAFQKLKTHTMLGGITYKDYTDGMIATADPSWSAPLIKMLEPEIERPKTNKEKEKIDNLKDQQFWQITAAQVLGELKDANAVEPLMKVILDPGKGDVAATAVLALVKIGKPAVDRALKLLDDSDTKLRDYHFTKVMKATDSKKPPDDDPQVRMGAIILGTIGNSSAESGMIAALEKTDKLPQKAVIARELAKFPPTAATKKAFKDTYALMKIDTTLPETRGNALEMLTEAASAFYDPDFIPWLFETIGSMKGGAEDLKSIQAIAVSTASKLMKPDQVKLVKEHVEKWGTKIEKDGFALAEKVVTACQDKAACYLTQIEKSENQDEKAQFAGITAGYQIGVHGDAKTVDGILERASSLENAAVRHVAAQTIDYLCPKGNTAAADAIDKIIRKNVESADRNKVAGDSTLKQVMYRIRSRAGG